MKEKGEHFAVGFNKYKVFWIFVFGGIMGCIIETIWCYFAFGELSSRTSNLFLPFSTVWGLGCALFTIFLHKMEEQKIYIIFLKGYLLGGIFEFLCGWVCQQFLGVTFWDYSGLPFTLGYYVNLVFCIFWGLVAVVWAKKIYPLASAYIEKVPKKTGMILTRCAVLFMVLTMSVSALALFRMSARKVEQPARNLIEHKLDQYFPDVLLQQYFPKMKYL